LVLSSEILYCSSTAGAYEYAVPPVVECDRNPGVVHAALVRLLWFFALVLAAVGVWKFGPGMWARHEAAVATEQRRLAAIAARADQQHAWIRACDDRGAYGQYPPAAM
jgi:hypothetical protein